MRKKSTSFKIDMGILLDLEDKFWDECIDSHHVMYWPLDNVTIQVNPRPREEDEAVK